MRPAGRAPGGYAAPPRWPAGSVPSGQRARRSSTKTPPSNTSRTSRKGWPSPPPAFLRPTGLNTRWWGVRSPPASKHSPTTEVPSIQKQRSDPGVEFHRVRLASVVPGDPGRIQGSPWFHTPHLGDLARQRSRPRKATTQEPYVSAHRCRATTIAGPAAKRRAHRSPAPWSPRVPPQTNDPDLRLGVVRLTKESTRQ